MWLLSVKEWRVGYLEENDDIVDNEVLQRQSVEKMRI
jgi:hypothetical protein